MPAASACEAKASHASGYSAPTPSVIQSTSHRLVVVTAIGTTPSTRPGCSVA